MKFFCDNCNAKYQIADERVRGKVVKVRCKRCDEIITVSEQTSQQSGGGAAGGGQRDGGGADGVEWYYSLQGQNQGPFSEQQLVEKFRNGEVGSAAYVWNDSFSDWKPAGQVEPFSSALGAAEGRQSRPSESTGGPSKRKKTMGVQGQIEAVQEAPEDNNRKGSRRSRRRDRSKGKGRGKRSSRRRRRDGDGDRKSRSRRRNKGDDSGSGRRRSRKKKKGSDDGGREERLNRLRNKLKSSFGSGGGDEPTEETPDEQPPAEESGVAPTAERSTPQQQQTPERSEPGADADADSAEAPAETVDAPASDFLGDERIDGLEEGDERTVEVSRDDLPSLEEMGAKSGMSPEQGKADDPTIDQSQQSVEQAGGDATGADGDDRPAPESRQQPEQEQAAQQGAAQQGQRQQPSPEQSGGFELPPSGSSRIESQKEDQGQGGASDEHQATDDGLFATVDAEDDEEKAALPTAPSLSGDAEQATSGGGDTGVTQSLLIQLDKIQNEGKGKRFAAIAAGVVLLLAGGGTWYYIWSTSEKDDGIVVAKDEKKFHPEADDDGPVEKTYSQDEQNKILSLTPQVVEEDKKDDEGEKDEEKAKEREEQTTVARNTNNNPSGGSSGSLLERSAVLGEDDGPTMDEALEGATKKSVESGSKGKKLDESKAVASAGVDSPDMKKKSRGFEAMNAVEGSSPSIQRPDETIGKSESSGGGLPSKLTKEQIRDGIGGVRKSVGVCRQRHSRRGVPLEVRKIYLTVEVKPSGRVVDYDISPSKLEGTVFERCLHSHKGRWHFGEFDGSTQKLKAPFILQ